MHTRADSLAEVLALTSGNRQGDVDTEQLVHTLVNSLEEVDLKTHRRLRGSLPKSGPLDFATKNTFPLFLVGEEALVVIY